MANGQVSKKVAGAKAVKEVAPTAVNSPARAYVMQEDVPAYSLEDALRIPRAIQENYGGHPTTPFDVASALNLQPGSSKFRMLCGAALAYGLTDASYKAAAISPTALARRIFAPLAEDDDLAAKREAVMKPRVLREFLNKYSGSTLPRPDIGQNVLGSMGVPEDRKIVVWDLIIATAEHVGFIREIKGKNYVHLGAARPLPAPAEQAIADSVQATEIPEAAFDQPSNTSSNVPIVRQTQSLSLVGPNRKVFITHGRNMSFIEPIKKLLGFGELIPVVSVERQTVSQPVPDKVMNDMRDCSAAIIHVEGERTLIDTDAKEHTVINPNVLIEIGAAMALYGRRFILLVRNGVHLPSNLQGLYEVRYEGDTLDGMVTIRLLEAINSMKNTPLPGQN